MLRITDIQDGKVDWDSVPTCEIAQADIGRFRLAPGDLVFARTGATVGKSFLIGQVPNAVFASYLIRLRPADTVNTSYLRWFLNSPLYWNQIGRAAAGIAQPNVNATKLSRIAIPVAPLAEQERIVAAIEEQFSRLDAGIAALDRVRRRLESLGGQFADFLISGDDFATEERSGSSGGWPTVPLESVCPVFVDCAHRTPRYARSGIPALRPRDVVGGLLRLASAAQVDELEFQIQTRRHIPQPGDVIYSRELSYGWAALVPPGRRLCLSQGMVLFRPGASVMPEYLVLVLNSRVGRRQADAAATGTAHPHINLRDILRYEIPVPPISVQERMVVRHASGATAFAVASRSVSTAMSRSEALRAGILAAAFSGKLVPQDCADEPASVLLERVAADPASSNIRQARVRKLGTTRRKVSL